MKVIGILLSLIILTSPMREHVDVIVFDNTTEHSCNNTNEFDIEEDGLHHDQDNDDERNSKHHHHCVDMSITNIFTPLEFEFRFVFSPEFKKSIFSYKSLQSSKFSDRLYQPPQV